MVESLPDNLKDVLSTLLEAVAKDGGSVHLFYSGTTSVSLSNQDTFKIGTDFVAIEGPTCNREIIPLSAITRCQYLR